MEHAEVLELIELAAVEQDGIERLAAGDTPEAAVVAGHLAGCEPCAAELARIARTSAVARDAIRELPDPALRACTLAFVREVGVDRSARAATDVAASLTAMPAVERAEPAAAVDVPQPAAAIAEHGVPVSASTAAPEAAIAPAVVIPLRARSRTPWWAAAGVAAVLVAGVAGFATGGALRPGGTGDEPAIAMAAAQTTMHIAEQPDAVHLALAPTGGDMAKGTVIYSPTTTELSMAVSGLAATPAGSEYACWVEQGGQRKRIGTLYVEGHNGTWAGIVEGLASLEPGSAFGVSLVAAGDSTGTPVLRGGG